MLISMNWISDFVDLTGLDKMALIRQFSLSTAEVENEIFHKGADLSGVVAAQIVSVENHPESHKLHLLKGLKRILLDIDKAIRIIRETEEEAEVIPNLMIGFGIWRGEADTVLAKAIRLCMECVGIG